MIPIRNVYFLLLYAWHVLDEDDTDAVFAASIMADVLSRARTVCEFDELSHDILPNCILKATIRDLLRTQGISRKLRPLLRAVWHRMHDIADVPVTSRVFGRVQIHRNN